MRQEIVYPESPVAARELREEAEMPQNEEGEFELVLGNKQLLTVFFIVVVLLGIFATMGYIVGRSTVPAPVEAKATPSPLIVDPTKPSDNQSHGINQQTSDDVARRSLAGFRRKQ